LSKTGTFFLTHFSEETGMKKNFLTTVAVMVSALFMGTVVAEVNAFTPYEHSGGKVTFGGELMPRFEWDDRDLNDSTDANSFVSTRVRLDATADILPDLSAFIQLQSVRTWGNTRFNADATLPTNPGTQNSQFGSGDAAFSPNDNDSSVGIHQGYFKVKNALSLPVDATVGRQEVILDGHRLFGNTLWTVGAQSHDAVRLDHQHDNLHLLYVYSFGAEGGQEFTDVDNSGDVDVHVLYGQLQGVLGGALSAYYVFLNDECGGAVVCTAAADNSFHTFGLRQAGQLFGLDYRVEGYYQTGDAESSIVGGGAGSGTELEAYMFGGRLGKKFNNVMWKPSLTVWYDYLSGTTDEDVTDNQYGSFNTLFDTGHKFYGFADYFLGVGSGSTATGTGGLGLQDFMIRATVEPFAKTKLMADFHMFWTASDESDVAGLAALGTGNDLGEELDITLTHMYNPNLKITAGYSHIWADDLLVFLRSQPVSGGQYRATDDNADWAYLQFHVMF
jgi:hypothetical protein